ncbi:MAG: hypothetical protein KAT34_21120 [Candidatus Aminicenantes bacterium]|nr:hypothetical protein [Candidatus Aminicenantes bacterium]
MILRSAGIVSMGGYLPAKEVPENKRKDLVEFLRKETLLYPEYIDKIETTGHLPGKLETNNEGWESQPWFECWLSSLPPRKRDNPFEGRKERRRVPLDPLSLKKSLYPHPMLSSDAETLAGALAIFNGKIDKDEIDLVLVHSLVPDQHVPMNASLVQHKLGLKNAGAYNIDTCCSSFITMLEIAMTYIRAGIKNKILIIGSSIDSIINDKSDYYSVNTGDGAAAAIITEVEEGYDYISSHSLSRGSRHKAILFMKRKPNLLIPTIQGPTHEQEFVTFNNMELCKEIAKNAGTDLADIINITLRKAKATVQDMDFFITHQPVPWTPHAWREAVGVPESKFYTSFEKYGNMAVACVPVNLLEAVEKGLINVGDKVMLASSGVGENYIALFQKIAPNLIKSNRL